MSELTLRRGPWSARLDPHSGGAISSLDHGRKSVLFPAPAGEIGAGGSFPCVPYFGRIRGAFDWRGARHQMAPTSPPHDSLNALHGEGWTAPWTITGRSASLARLRFSYSGGKGGHFPFPFIAEQCIRLDEDGLYADLSCRNNGAGAFPVGLALHPYFHRRKETVLRFGATGVWRPPITSDKGAFSPFRDDEDFRAPRRPPSRTLDQTYTGFDGTAEIIAGHSVIRLRSDAPFLHLYAPAGAPFLCLEPTTQLPGLYGTGAPLGGATLRPGGVARLSMRIGC